MTVLEKHVNRIYTYSIEEISRGFLCSKHKGFKTWYPLEMERDSLISHGTASFIKERLFDMSDPYQVIVCKKCGSVCTTVDECKACNEDNVVQVQIPYACKLLLQELNAMCIKTQITTKE